MMSQLLRIYYRQDHKRLHTLLVMPDRKTTQASFGLQKSPIPEFKAGFELCFIQQQK